MTATSATARSGPTATDSELAEAIEASGLSDSEIARRSACSRNIIAMARAGRGPKRASTRERLIQALEVQQRYTGPLWTVPRLAAHLVKHPQWVYEEIAREKLGCLRVGGEIRFTQEHVNEYLRSCEQQAVVPRARRAA